MKKEIRWFIIGAIIIYFGFFHIGKAEVIEE